MNEQLLTRLDAFAAKLGTSADKLWAIMLRQARVEAWTDSVVALICFGYVGAYVWFVVKNGKRIMDDDEGYVPAMVIGGIAGFALLVCGICATTALPTEFLNPGYFAFERIVSKLKP